MHVTCGYAHRPAIKVNARKVPAVLKDAVRQNLFCQLNSVVDECVHTPYVKKDEVNVIVHTESSNLFL